MTAGLRAVAARVRPGMRVGIDGVSGAGRTTFADALVPHVAAPVVRASFDDFHLPRAVRYARGETAESYYEDAFDAARFRLELLEPFARGEPVRTRVFDQAHDVPIDELPVQAPPNAVLVVDGIWLHKPELRGALDLTVWLEVDRRTALARAIERDRAWLDDPEARYATRYYPAETRYIDDVRPQELADLVIRVA